MNTLKPLLIIAVLAGIGYGVYTRINETPAAPPPGAAEAWGGLPQIQMPPGSAPGAPSAWNPPPAQIPGSGPAAFVGAPAVGVGASVDARSQVPGSPYAGPATAVGATVDARGQAAAPTYGVPTANAALSTSTTAVAQPPESTYQVPPYSPPLATASPPPGAPGAAAPPTEALRTEMPNHAYTNADSYPPPRDALAKAPAQPLTQPASSTPPPGVQVAAAAQAVPAGYAASTADNLRAPGAATAAAVSSSASTFTMALEEVRRQLDAGQLAVAHKQLSMWYDDPRLSTVDQQELNKLLDQLAGTVVYSTQYFVEPPYEVHAGERLEEIGEHYNVPWQLLRKINGIEDPQNLRQGERLKVVRGPFTAAISLEKRQLTLMLDGAYAGRFMIGVNRDQPPREGTYSVVRKQVDPVFHGPARTIDAQDPTNPLGNRLIELSDGISIHGTNDPSALDRVEVPGSVGLGTHDVEDVFDILGVGSQVVIHR